MFTLDTVGGNRTGVMSRLATALNTLTLVNQSSCYYALVKTVATQIQSPFGFVGTRHVKAHGEEHWRNNSMDSQMPALVKKSHTIALHASPAIPPELLPTFVMLLGISRVRCRLFAFATSQINVCNALNDPDFRVAHCFCPTRAL